MAMSYSEGAKRAMRKAVDAACGIDIKGKSQKEIFALMPADIQALMRKERERGMQRHAVDLGLIGAAPPGTFYAFDLHELFPTHKVVAYYDSDRGLGSRVLELRDGDDVRACLQHAMQGRVGALSYMGHEPQDDALRARGAAPGMDKQAFIHQRLGWIHSTRGVGYDIPAKRVLKAPTTEPMRKAMEGEWITQHLNAEAPQQPAFAWSKREDPTDWKVDPSPTPYMQLAQQAMAGRDFERKLEQLRKDQEELCGVKVSLDPAVGCDDFVISTGRRAGKTAGIAATLGAAQREATKSTEQMLIDAMQKLWGKTPVATIHDEVQVEADPSAVRDEIAMARGTCKPQNKPHKDEKPANPYPPRHPTVEPPAGLMAVSDMSFRMGNRWSA